MSSFLNSLLRENPDLKEAEIRGILYFLLNNPNSSLQELILNTGIPKNTLSNFLNSIKPFLKSKDANKIELLKKYLPQIKEVAKPFSFKFCEFVDKKLEEKIINIRKEYSLEPKREFDQFFAIPKTTVQKALVLEKIGMHYCKNVALIGDDDLVSVAIALKYPNILNITVLEIDDDLVKVIKSIANKHKLPIKVINYDVRNEIPTFLYKKFNVVMTDPPYTSKGVELFLDRSISLLKPHTDFSGNYVLLNYGNSYKSPEKFIEIQEIINKYYLFLETAIYKFNRYFGAQSIGSSSNLYVLKSTPNTMSKEIKYSDIYTYQQIKKEDFPHIEQFVFKVKKIPKNFFKSINFIDKSIRTFCKKHKIEIQDLKVNKIGGGSYIFNYSSKSCNLTLHTFKDHLAFYINITCFKEVKNPQDMPFTLSKIFKTNFIDFKYFN